jgi:hypothetical protein
MGSPPISRMYPDEEIWDCYGCFEFYKNMLVDFCLETMIIFETLYTDTIYPLYYKFGKPHVEYLYSFIEQKKELPISNIVEYTVEYYNCDGDKSEKDSYNVTIKKYDITEYWNVKVCTEMQKHGSLFSKSLKEILIEYFIDNNLFDDFEESKNIYSIRLNITLQKDFYRSGRTKYRFIGEDSRIIPLYMIPK